MGKHLLHRPVKKVLLFCVGVFPHDLLEDMGIRPGKEVEILNNGGGGALLVKVDDSRIAVKSYNLSLRKREAEGILLEVPK